MKLKNKKLYSSKRWHQLRADTLKRDNYQCQMCGTLLRHGRSDKRTTILRPAAIDHIIKHNGDEILFFDADNLWAICCDCHDIECNRIEKRYTGAQAAIEKLNYKHIGLDGFIVKRINKRHVDTVRLKLETWGRSKV